MTNEVVKKPAFGGLKMGMPNAAALADSMAQSAATAGGPVDGDYISFSGKRGVYEIGKDKEDADPKELWLVNVAGFEDGYICWKGGAVMAQRSYPLGTALPPLDKTEHGPFLKDGDGWYDSKTMVVKSLDTGKQGTFKINSVSGVSAFADLQRTITQRIRAGESYWPVISFGKEQFTAKGYKNSKPVLNIDGWLNDAAVELVAAAFEDETEIDMDELYVMSGAAVKEIAPPPEPAKKTRRAL